MQAECSISTNTGRVAVIREQDPGSRLRTVLRKELGKSAGKPRKRISSHPIAITSILSKLCVWLRCALSYFCDVVNKQPQQLDVRVFSIEEMKGLISYCGEPESSNCVHNNWQLHVYVSVPHTASGTAAVLGLSIRSVQSHVRAGLQSGDCNADLAAIYLPLWENLLKIPNECQTPAERRQKCEIDTQNTVIVTWTCS